jgi:hypothetical protein
VGEKKRKRDGHASRAAKKLTASDGSFHGAAAQLRMGTPVAIDVSAAV